MKKITPSSIYKVAGDMLQTLQVDGISPVIRAPDSTFLKKDELGCQVGHIKHCCWLLLSLKSDTVYFLFRASFELKNNI